MRSSREGEHRKEEQSRVQALKHIFFPYPTFYIGYSAKVPRERMLGPGGLRLESPKLFGSATQPL